jgi:hypothetical protein
VRAGRVGPQPSQDQRADPGQAGPVRPMATPAPPAE